MYDKLTLPVIRQAVPNHGEPWDDGDRSYLKRHLNKGRPIPEIAQDMGRSVNSLLFAMDSMGIDIEEGLELAQSVQEFREQVNKVILH